MGWSLVEISVQVGDGIILLPPEHHMSRVKAVKTVRMIVDFQKFPHQPTSITLCKQLVAFCFLYTIITQNLFSTGQQTIYFMWQMKFNLSKIMMMHSNLTLLCYFSSSITIQYVNVIANDKGRLSPVVHSAEKDSNHPVPGCLKFLTDMLFHLLLHPKPWCETNSTRTAR